MSVTLIHSVNMFLGIREQNVTFCIDISGSMYSTLKTVKEQLIQYLNEQSLLAKFNLNRLFNIIAFSTEVYPWANSMVLWNEATVNKASNWINDLETKTGTNTLDALLAALQDQMTHGVVLVTDDICDQDPYSLLNQVSQVACGRPIHCIYVTNSTSKDRDEEDRSAIQFLQNLSTITRGSFKIVSIGRLGIDKITPISSPNDLCTMFQLSNLTANALTNYSTLNLNESTNNSIMINSNNNNLIAPISYNLNSIPSLITNYVHPKWLVDPNVYSFPSLITFPRVHIISDNNTNNSINNIPSRSIAWSRFRPIRILNNGSIIGLTHDPNTVFGNDIAYTPDAGSLLLNKTVLARSSLDGYYYKGKILNQILAHRFMIQFGPHQHGRYKDCYYQDTAVYDIIHFDDAMSHSITKNDKVLAAIDNSNDKYAPAEVLDGYEKRNSSNQTMSDSKLTVKFMNGKTRTVEPNEAMWIPDAMFERIKFELNLPTTARKYLEEYNEDYPNSVTNAANKTTNSCESVIMPRLVYDIWPYYVPFYPLYSNLLYPTTMIANKLMMTQQPIQTTQNFVLDPKMSEPVFFRQMKCNRAAVDAETINKNVFDASNQLTLETLEEKVRKQIEKHKHLLYSSNNNEVQDKCCDCDLKNSTRYKKKNDSINESCESLENIYKREKEDDEINDNKYYKFYKRLIKELYKDSNKSNEDLRSSSSLLRSKSVTFSDDLESNRYTSSNCYDSPNWTPYSKSCHQNHIFRESDHETDEFDYYNTNKSRNKDGSMGNKCSSHIVPTKKMVDRFGNPNVSIGLPEKSFMKQRPLSASASTESLKANMDKFKKDLAVKRENEKKERISEDIKRQSMRDEYLRHYSNQVKEFEKNRTEASFLKAKGISDAKKDLNAKTIDRLNANKIDIETKEQMKYAHLRSQGAKRDLARMEKLADSQRKEQQKLTFKQMEQFKRNLNYNDRLVIEEAYRNSQQKLLEKKYNRNKANEALRENRGQKLRQVLHN